MTLMRKINLASVLGLAALAFPLQASAATITANCTGMLNFDIYTIDTERATQEVEGIGTSEFSMDEKFIYLRGDFGEYKFDLKAGTLYLNDSDTSVYCTYSGIEK